MYLNENKIKLVSAKVCSKITYYKTLNLHIMYN